MNGNVRYGYGGAWPTTTQGTGQQYTEIIKAIQELQEAQELGQLTGDISEQELAEINELATLAYQSLEESVTRTLEKTMGTEIAQLTERGVLPGTIGAYALGDIGERAAFALSEGGRGIETTKLEQILGMREAAKGRATQLEGAKLAGEYGLQMAGMQAGAAETASKWGAFGEMLGMGAAGLIGKYF